MRVIESTDITQAAALAVHQERVVLVLRHGLLEKRDFTLLAAVLGCVSGRVEPGVAVLADTG